MFILKIKMHNYCLYFRNMTLHNMFPMNILQTNTTIQSRRYFEENFSGTSFEVHTVLDKVQTDIDEAVETIYDVNAQEVKTLYPLIIFYTFILIVGILGNGHVLLVYLFRYKRSPARVYILFLAGIDFSMCLFGIPYHLTDLTNPYTYTNATACKSLTFIITTLFFMSVFALLVIAIDRYLKICKPLGKLQVAYFGKKRACCIAVLVSVLLSWPNIMLYGRGEMEQTVNNVTGYACYYETQYYETHYPFIYTIMIVCICLASTVFLVVAYSLICHKIRTRYKYIEKPHLRDGDIEITEEVSLRSTSIMMKCSPFKNEGILRNRSLEDMASPRNIQDGRLVAGNSNESLKFIGDIHVSADKDCVDKQTSTLLIKCVSNLHSNIPDKKEHINSHRRNSYENIPSFINSTDKLSQSTNVNCTLKMNDVINHDSCSDNSNTHSSLEVPNTDEATSKMLSLRRNSDKTSRKNEHASQQIDEMNSEKPTVLERLRVHYTSHQIDSIQGPIKAEKAVSRQHSKITKIMLTITIIFIFSYSPVLAITLWSIIVPTFWDTLSEQHTILCEFFLRIYLINNICNPFIYGFWDKRFKHESAHFFNQFTSFIRIKLRTFGE